MDGVYAAPARFCRFPAEDVDPQVSVLVENTRHEETGIGDWTETEFIDGMRTGTHRGIGRPILPPMPWFNLSMATDEDLQAIFAYLQSIPAVENQVPDAIDPPAG